ncbi:MAG: hypothetical protein COC05_03490 [Gammaproteobacteria bacterium]|nr:MAG: hypothetical protein COC05_03490 [Gammaproteobacteria bacterium]
MKNIALITLLVGLSANAQAQETFGYSDINNDSQSKPASIVSGNIGRNHGYTIPFVKVAEINSNGQHADASEFGRITNYDNAINKLHVVSGGIYADTGEYGRLDGYSEPEVANGHS